MRKFIIAAALASFVVPAATVAADPPRWAKNDKHDRYDQDQRKAERKADRRYERQVSRSDYRQYDYNRPDPRYGNYRADRYYVADNQYQPRYLSANDRVYRGQDNQYYCRRSDGTTGLVIGGLAGGLLGNQIAPGGSKLLGTVLGGGAGALIGRAIDRGSGNRVTCR